MPLSSGGFAGLGLKSYGACKVAKDSFSACIFRISFVYYLFGLMGKDRPKGTLARTGKGGAPVETAKVWKLAAAQLQTVPPLDVFFGTT